jgi:hypothetical protein
MTLANYAWVRRLWKKYPIGSAYLRTKYDIWERPNYAYGMLFAARLARQLGHAATSVLEFGVAGGTGLVAMDRIAAELGPEMGVEMRVYGFDSGQGMPAPLDYRDLPYAWQQGFFPMDEARLLAELRTAELVLGDVTQTVPRFLEGDVAPIGFISFDLDFYSSTKAAFEIFAGPAASRLPRIVCYFDDIIGPEHACYCDRTGELAAIREFNEEHRAMHIAPFNGLRHMRPIPARWNEQMFVFHDFEHPDYCRPVIPPGQWYRQMPLK